MSSRLDRDISVETLTAVYVSWSSEIIKKADFLCSSVWADLTLHPPPSLVQAECVYVGPGNISCVCIEGWTGDGNVCVEINNCELESRGGCSTNGNCNHIGPGQVDSRLISHLSVAAVGN